MKGSFFLLFLFLGDGVRKSPRSLAKASRTLRLNHPLSLWSLEPDGEPEPGDSPMHWGDPLSLWRLPIL